MFAKVLLASMCLITSSLANAQLSVRNLSWRKAKLEMQFVLQPEDDTAHLSVKGFGNLASQGWFQLFFPVCVVLKETPQINTMNYGAKWDFTQKPVTAEPVYTIAGGKYVDTQLAVINNSSPDFREKLKSARKICDLTSFFNMELREKVVKPTWSDFSSEIYISSGTFFTVRSDAFYPFDEKVLWTGIGAPESTDAVIVVSNPSSFRMSEPEAYLSDPWNPEKNLGRLPRLQFSQSNFRVRSNLESNTFLTIKAKVTRSNRLIQFLPFLLAILAFYQGRKIDFKHPVRNIYITFFASILALILLAPNHPVQFTLYDSVILGGYFIGISWAACMHYRFKGYWPWVIAAAVVLADVLIWSRVAHLL
jgi:hypothetical protein